MSRQWQCILCAFSGCLSMDVGFRRLRSTMVQSSYTPYDRESCAPTIHQCYSAINLNYRSMRLCDVQCRFAKIQNQRTKAISSPLQHSSPRSSIPKPKSVRRYGKTNKARRMKVHYCLIGRVTIPFRLHIISRYSDYLHSCYYISCCYLCGFLPPSSMSGNTCRSSPLSSSENDQR